MAYEARNWVNNETIPASELNRIELGVSQAHARAATAEKVAAEAAKDAVELGRDLAEVMDELDQLREAVATLTS